MIDGEPVRLPARSMMGCEFLRSVEIAAARWRQRSQKLKAES
jgi:hypothetical protein